MNKTKKSSKNDNGEYVFKKSWKSLKSQVSISEECSSKNSSKNKKIQISDDVSIKMDNESINSKDAISVKLDYSRVKKFKTNQLENSEIAKKLEFNCVEKSINSCEKESPLSSVG